MAIDWRSLRDSLRAELEGFTLFVEMPDDSLRPIEAFGADPRDVVGLAAAQLDTEPGTLVLSQDGPARELAKRLAGRAELDAYPQMSRDMKTFVGLYVRIRPRQGPDDRVIFNGKRVSADWPAMVEQAQAQGSYVINGVKYPRIRFGDEESVAHMNAVGEPCHDCAVLRGQYHVGPLCDNEECPCCHGQVIGCDCDYEGDE
jgi:hypothetical protein